ncbi:MAG: DUF4118 domain-containing protein, partial [Gammaproteobacteria bacterium]|nr:DUF4118 domain-containing protein [Gammaproteobacteria bacterium]
TQTADNIWLTNERLLVCVGADDGSAKLIRAARRMATRLQAEWTAVYVDSPRLRLSEEEKMAVHKNLRLAEQLGAQTAVISGRDVVKEVIAYAMLHNVSKIILSKQIRPRWKDLLFGSLVDELVRNSKDIDIYIIRDDGIKKEKPMWLNRTRRSPFKSYLSSSLYVILTTLVSYALQPYIAGNIIMLYLLMVILVAMRGQRGPAIWASIFSVLVYDFLFIPPIFSFAVTDAAYLITLIALLAVGQIISHLTLLAQEQTENARNRERYLTELQLLSKKLAQQWQIEDVLKIGVGYIAEILDSEVYALMPKKNNQLAIASASNNDSKTLEGKQLAVAQWVYELMQPAGLGTETLPNSESLYLPLIASEKILGVLQVKPHKAKRLFNSEELRILQSCVSQIATKIDVINLHLHAQEIRAEIDNERVRNALLNAVSHDLRTPLTSIMGASSSLMTMTQDETKELAQTIYSQSARLDRLITNLLQVAVLDEGKIKLIKELNSIEEVIGTSLKFLSKELNAHPLTLNIAKDLPLVKFDSLLLEQVLINLLENAAHYTQPQTAISINAYVCGDYIECMVSDQGAGIAEDELNLIFGKFYRGKNTNQITGSGLGLTICQAIIQAHGGTMWAKLNQPHGLSFYFTLPKEAAHE